MDNDNKKLIDDIIERAKDIRDIDPRGALIYVESSEKLEVLVGGDIRSILYAITHLINRVGAIYETDPHNMLEIIDGGITILNQDKHYKVDLSEVIEIDDQEEG